APYLRLETLEYTERSTDSLQLNGRHTFPVGEFGIDNFITFFKPSLDWTLSDSHASLNQPDKRQVGALCQPASFHPRFPPFIAPLTSPPTWFPYKPAENFTLGNVQRIWKDIDEHSNQYAVDVKLPFKQWSDDEGYVKTGVFDDHVKRNF